MYGSQAIREQFETALAQYSARLMQVSASLAERQQQAMRAYAEAETPVTRDRAIANPQEYEDLIGAIAGQDSGKIAAAQTAYVQSVQTLHERAAASARSALSQYLKQIEMAWLEAQEESKTSWAAYTEAVRKAFAILSAMDIDAATLAAIGQTLTTAALYAGGSMQSPPATPRPLQT